MFNCKILKAVSLSASRSLRQKAVLRGGTGLSNNVLSQEVRSGFISYQVTGAELHRTTSSSTSSLPLAENQEVSWRIGFGVHRQAGEGNEKLFLEIQRLFVEVVLVIRVTAFYTTAALLQRRLTTHTLQERGEIREA